LALPHFSQRNQLAFSSLCAGLFFSCLLAPLPPPTPPPTPPTTIWSRVVLNSAFSHVFKRFHFYVLLIGAAFRFSLRFQEKTLLGPFFFVIPDPLISNFSWFPHCYKLPGGYEIVFSSPPWGGFYELESFGGVWGGGGLCAIFLNSCLSTELPPHGETFFHFQIPTKFVPLLPLLIRSPSPILHRDTVSTFHSLLPCFLALIFVIKRAQKGVSLPLFLLTAYPSRKIRKLSLSPNLPCVLCQIFLPKELIYPFFEISYLRTGLHYTWKTPAISTRSARPTLPLPIVFPEDGRKVIGKIFFPNSQNSLPHLLPQPSPSDYKPSCEGIPPFYMLWLLRS